MRFVDLLIRRGRFSEVSPLLAGLGKDKQMQDSWLESVEAILQDVYFSQIAPGRVSQQDLQADLAGLARIVSRAELVSMIEAFKKFRLALTRNVNRQIALEAIFLAHALRAS